MSTLSDICANLLEQAQEIVDDAVEDVPGAKGVWTIGDKYFSARKIRAIIDEGRRKLHDAAQLLADRDAKAALEGVDEYLALLQRHSELDVRGTELQKLLDSIRFYQFWKKYGMRADAVAFREKSCLHQWKVQEVSDRARLGLNPHDGTLPPDIHRPNITVASGDMAGPGLRSEQTLIHGTQLDDLVENVMDVDIARLADLLEYAETNSIVGNPWVGDD